jgi:hypothetical protein
MYAPVIALLMLIGPLLCVALELQQGGSGFLAAAVVKWFAFWAAGLRLLLAGFKQNANPAFTAESILGTSTSGSNTLVLEVGFGNLALGSIGVLSLWLSSWQQPAALGGAIFFALAGINDGRQRQRNRLENLAMVSDLFAAVLLLAGLMIALLVTSNQS